MADKAGGDHEEKRRGASEGGRKQGGTNRDLERCHAGYQRDHIDACNRVRSGRRRDSSDQPMDLQQSRGNQDGRHGAPPCQERGSIASIHRLVNQLETGHEEPAGTYVETGSESLNSFFTAPDELVPVQLHEQV